MERITVPSLRADGLGSSEDIELTQRAATRKMLDTGNASDGDHPVGDVESSVVPAGPADVPSQIPDTRWKARAQMGSICWTMFALGWGDGSTGPLLPRIQQNYHVGFLIVSLIFVTNCVGIITGGLANVYLNERVGFGKILAAAACLSIAACSIQATAPPFPVFIVSYLIQGLGASFMNAHTNGYVSRLRAQSLSLGIAHACYGMGAFAAPLASTHFSQTRHWSFQYLLSLGMAVVNLTLTVAVFRFRRQDECLAEIGETVSEPNNSTDNMYRQIFRDKVVHLLALFVLAYVGVEVTIGGWAVTYIIQVRHGGPASGYISSGFFGGLAFGRVALLWINKKLGHRRAVLLYVILAIGLELVVWLVPSLISGAVSIALIGLILGPIFPIVMGETSKIIPRFLLTGTIGWIAAFGTSGSAALPFVTGTLAQEKGIWTLQPLMISMMVVMVGMWLLIPKNRERIE